MIEKPTMYQMTFCENDNRTPEEARRSVNDNYKQGANIAGQALTYDEGKEPLAHLPWAAIDELSKVQAHGHKKYKDFNNYRKGMEVSRNISCALRHIRDYMGGRDSDLESGINPLAHAICRLAFVLQNLKDGMAIDDRYSHASAVRASRKSLEFEGRYPDRPTIIKDQGRQKP